MTTAPSPTPLLKPRRSTLLGLGAVVLLAHLVLLNGGLPDLSAAPASTPPPVQPALAPTATTHGATAPAPVPVARVSTVRWISPRPAVAEAPEPVPLAVAAKPSSPRKPATPTRPAASAELAPPAPALAEPAPSETVVQPEPAVVAVAVEAPPSPPTSDALPTIAMASAAPHAAGPAGPALPPSLPPPSARLQFEVRGSVRGNPYHASGTLDWQHGQSRYDARMEVRIFLLGSRVQTSSGQVGPEGLLPERFADKARNERAAHFERDQHRIRFSSNAPQAELQPGAQDRLSLFFQIAGLLHARPQAYAAGQVIEMQVAGTGDAETWRFQVGEESTLSLPAGELRARHVVRLPRKEFDSTVEMWLAPSLNHLPVRLRVTQPHGDTADQQLSEMPG